MKSLAWKSNYEDNIKLLDSVINQKKYSVGIRNIPESKIEKELIKIQKLTEGENLESVVADILSNSSEDDWYRKGKQSLQNGSPTSAHLIWLQCENSLKLNLKEVFLFELNLAVQITRKGDFKEGVRALIVDKDNNPKWKFNSIEKVSQDWINQHTEPAWETNPLENL